MSIRWVEKELRNGASNPKRYASVMRQYSDPDFPNEPR